MNADGRVAGKRRRALAGLFVVFLVGCGGFDAPVAPAGERPSDRVPVVVVPGITGTELIDDETGDVIWGTGPRLLAPRDGGYGTMLPVTPAVRARASRPGEVMRRVRLLAVIRRDVYGRLASTLAANGYREGSLEAPRPDDEAFLFPYDWRLDNLYSVRRLHDALDRLRRVRGEERLRVAMVCQSNGAHLCRYLAKYGPASLDDALAGKAGPPETLEITRLVLVGSANGGGLRILRFLDRGRRYVPVVGRKLQPEVLFTLPSLYQDLPAYRDDGYFLGDDGRPLDVDLYDPTAWEEYGFSVFDPDVRARIEKNRPPELGTEDDRRRFLAAQLERARRFQEALHREVPDFPDIPYFLVQNAYADTPDRAVLRRREEGRDGDGWELLMTGDEELKQEPWLEALVTAPGDEHATLRSQRWMSEGELALVAAEPFYVHGGHFEMILRRPTLRQIVRFLHEPIHRRPHQESEHPDISPLPGALSSQSI